MAESPPQTIRRKRPWAVTFFGLISICGLVLMPLLAGNPEASEMPDIVRFLGHFHPLVLHLPIGVFTLILFQELGVIFFRRGREAASSSLFPMFFGVASAIVTVIAGFLLFQGERGDYEGNAIVERHLWGGLVFAVAAVLTFIVKAWTVSLSANRAWYRLLLFVSVGVMCFAGHDGASITHGRDYLTEYAPAQIRRLLGLDPAKPSASGKPSNGQGVYADIVHPILERRCVQCHKEEKSKGELRLDTFEMLVKGGKEGSAINPGDADGSLIVARIELPEDDDEHMPPEGKPQVGDDELMVIKWWLDQGADPARKLGDYQVPADIGQAITRLHAAPSVGPDATSAHPRMEARSGPDEALESMVAELSMAFPGALSFESRGSSLVDFTAVSLRGKLDDAGFAGISPVIPYLVRVNLSATRVTDKSVALLEKASHLRQLRLAETGVTDASIETLLKLPALESVNLFGTKVTDAGVLKLTALPNLKHLYLWQTTVTPETVQSLREKLPDCEIVTGAAQ